MTVLLSVLGLLAVAALTLGTAISVASEFALTALERSQVDGHVAEVGDRRALRRAAAPIARCRSSSPAASSASP